VLAVLFLFVLIDVNSIGGGRIVHVMCV